MLRAVRAAKDAAGGVDPGHVLADNGYNSRKIRAHPRRRGIPHTIPECVHRIPGRPSAAHAADGRPGFTRRLHPRRSDAERSFDRPEQGRGPVTGHDKIRESCHAAVTTASILLRT
ncbi:hypothetical protein AB0N31_00890 [Streptomyces sp. NPDC051051]|uniref:hypothetical protein n=1 Tax=Streptomyces sp. NPDC051051 TaxID=3155666 RepID=UPI003440E8AF